MVLSLLQNIEAITLCRDRDRLLRALLRAVVGLLGKDTDVAIFSCEPKAGPILRVFSGPNTMKSTASLWPGFHNEVRHDGKLVTRVIQGRSCGALMLQSSELSADQMALVFDS